MNHGINSDVIVSIFIKEKHLNYTIIRFVIAYEITYVCRKTELLRLTDYNNRLIEMCRS